MAVLQDVSCVKTKIQIQSFITMLCADFMANWIKYALNMQNFTVAVITFSNLYQLNILLLYTQTSDLAMKQRHYV